MAETIGKIKYLIHPESNGFLTYINEKGEEDSIYFSCNAPVHKKSHSVWLKGDIVSFDIELQKEDRLFARVNGYIGNELLDSLKKRVEEDKSNVIYGRLKVHYDKLYFVELATKISFYVTNLNPNCLKDIDPAKVFEAYYDPAISERCVRLTEADYVDTLLRTRKRTKQSIMAIVTEVHPDYLIVNIPNSYVVGKVIKFEEGHWYNPEDIIEVYFVSNANGTLSFIEKQYCVLQLKRQPKPDKIYHATVIEKQGTGTYIVELERSGIQGFFRPTTEDNPVDVGDEVDLYFSRINTSSDYIFISPETYQKQQGSIEDAEDN